MITKRLKRKNRVIDRMLITSRNRDSYAQVFILLILSVLLQQKVESFFILSVSRLGTAVSNCSRFSTFDEFT